MSEQPNQNNKTLLIVIIIVVILGVLTAGWYFLQYKPAQVAKEKARQEQLAKAAAEKKRQEQAAQKRARYDQLIEDADTAYEQENWESAQSLYSEALGLYPNQTYPQDQLALVNEKLDELAALEARRAAGIVETVSSRTGRYYVIVSSSIDDDLAMDYARKLAKEGNIAKIIAHDADNKSFYGVSLGDYATWEEATAASASFSSYGNGGGVWVLKY